MTVGASVVSEVDPSVVVSSVVTEVVVTEVVVSSVVVVVIVVVVVVSALFTTSLYESHDFVASAELIVISSSERTYPAGAFVSLILYFGLIKPSNVTTPFASEVADFTKVPSSKVRILHLVIFHQIQISSLIQQ